MGSHITHLDNRQNGSKINATPGSAQIASLGATDACNPSGSHTLKSMDIPQRISLRGAGGQLVTLDGLTKAKADMLCLAPSLFTHFPPRDADSVDTFELEEKVQMQLDVALELTTGDNTTADSVTDKDG